MLDRAVGPVSVLGRTEEIAIGRAAGEGVRAIARRIRRDPSTVSRELRRNRALDRTPPRYRATLAQSKAEERARRPKTSKLAAHPQLRKEVQSMLEERMSPEQITGRLPLLFPNDGTMRVSHEAIYQALYIQGRGALRRELTMPAHRTGSAQTTRARRRPPRADQGHGHDLRAAAGGRGPGGAR